MKGLLFRFCFAVFCAQSIVAFAGGNGASDSFRRSLFVADDYQGYGRNDVLTNPLRQKELLEFCVAPYGNKKAAVKRIYFSAGWHGFESVSADDNKLKAFVAALHEIGVEIALLQGCYGWATPEGGAIAGKVIDNVLAFNREAKPEERFDGLLLDVEPYVLNATNGDSLDWEKDTGKIWKCYLEVLDSISGNVRTHNISADDNLFLGECIPDWYPADPGESPMNFREVIDRVDLIWLMSYRDDLDALYASVIDELTYSQRTKKPAVVGYYVNMPNEAFSIAPGNTFWQEGNGVLEKTISGLKEKCKDLPSFGEVCVYSYIHYKKLKP